MKKRPILTDLLPIERIRFCRIAVASEVLDKLKKYLPKTNTEDKNYVRL